MPRRWHRAGSIRWLKRIHAWTGLWGALLFLMMGVSGFLLNHRSVLKIETGKPVEVSAMTIAVAPGVITDGKLLGVWAKTQLGLASEPKTPRGEAEPGAAKRFLGRDHRGPETLKQQFVHPDGRVTVTYVPGAASVAVRQDAQNVFGLITNLHKGSGLGVAWVLFLDTIAGALTAMSLTGFLLWTRLHGTRLAAGVIGLGSLVLAMGSVWPFLL